MRLILLGAPGAGKGTQAVVLAEELKVPHISTGDIFRSNIKNCTELGKKAKEYIDKGALVPDEITIGIVKDRITQSDCQNGFILDGFPRTIPQAEYLDETLDEIKLSIDYVIDVHVSDEDIVKRLSSRRVCPGCGMSYNILSNPPKKESKCDRCGEDLIQREDDSEETVLKRLKTYHDQTEPLIEYYNKRGKLLVVDGNRAIEATFQDILKALGVNK